LRRPGFNLTLTAAVPEPGTYAVLKKVFIERLQLKPEQYSLDAQIIDDLGADSLNAVELIMSIEEEFDIEISDDDATR
jgi:acyl carrier protein